MSIKNPEDAETKTPRLSRYSSTPGSNHDMVMVTHDRIGTQIDVETDNLLVIIKDGEIYKNTLQ
jgi:hypothetical protein